MVAPLQVSFVGAAGMPTRHVSVDGMTASGPNLSHWPGNRTPPRYKADLTTGICLRFARAPADERAAFLGGAEAVVNDHYDTDGFLSILALARPQVALARASVCLEAAATGDYQAYQSERGFAIDRTVLNLLTATESPLREELAGRDYPEQALRCYRWLVAHAEAVLDEPIAWAPLWQAEHAVVRAQIDAAANGAIERRRIDAAALTVLSSKGPVHRMVLNTLAEDHYRVLHIQARSDGPQVRYHDRTESWFEVQTFTPPPRPDLRPLAAQLQRLEGPPRGPVQWCADPPNQPVPELYHGIPAPQEYGQVTRTLAPSRLATEAIETECAAYLATG